MEAGPVGLHLLLPSEVCLGQLSLSDVLQLFLTMSFEFVSVVQRQIHKPERSTRNYGDPG